MLCIVYIIFVIIASCSLCFLNIAICTFCKFSSRFKSVDAFAMSKSSIRLCAAVMFS